MLQGKNRGIYIHIPFCRSKCPYCDFYSTPKHTPALREAFVRALENEIEYYGKAWRAYEDKPVESVYFGGGTPSLLDETQFERLMERIRKNFTIEDGAEISMEANPATVTEEKLAAYRRAGLSRLSIGAQSFDSKVLKILGRIHSPSQIEEAFLAAREAGFTNISLDLMFGIAGQSPESWENSVKSVIRLAPEHVSLYSLEIMDNTRFAKEHEAGIYRETEESEDRRMYERALEMLEGAGYLQYEISNAAKPGYACRHNLRYWNMGEYLGLGPSAHSFMDGIRYANAADLEGYIEAMTAAATDAAEAAEEINMKIPLSPAVTEAYENTEQDNLSEYLFTGLRKNEGISKSAFRRTFGKELWDCFPNGKKEFESFVSAGFAKEDAEGIRLTRAGMNISNKIMMIFV